MRNVYGDPGYKKIQEEMTVRYHKIRKEIEAPTYEKYAPKRPRVGY
jgi:hypothetical protein